jgi:hypothetical protein
LQPRRAAAAVGSSVYDREEVVDMRAADRAWCCQARAVEGEILRTREVRPEVEDDWDEGGGEAMLPAKHEVRLALGEVGVVEHLAMRMTVGRIVEHPIDQAVERAGRSLITVELHKDALDLLAAATVHPKKQLAAFVARSAG